MSSFAIAFILLPCVAASVVAWFVTDWRLAGAIAAGSLGVLFVPGLTSIWPTVSYLLPGFAGAVVGASVSGVATYRSRDTTGWSRMLYALVITFFLAVCLILFVISGGR